MRILGALICMFRGHDWRLVGPQFGCVKHICRRCRRTKHTRMVSTWYDMRLRAEGEIRE